MKFITKEVIGKINVPNKITKRRSISSAVNFHEGEIENAKKLISAINQQDACIADIQSCRLQEMVLISDVQSMTDPSHQHIDISKTA